MKTDAPITDAALRMRTDLSAAESARQRVSDSKQNSANLQSTSRQDMIAGQTVSVQNPTTKRWDKRGIIVDLDILNKRSNDEINKKYEEEESCEEKEAQTRTITDNKHVQTSRWWRKDWNKEEEEVIRKMNQRPTPNEEGKRSTKLDASFVVQDWPWSAENAPLIGEYRPWPGNPQARPNHAGGRNSQDQDNLNNQITPSSNGNQTASPEQETKQQAK
jgi:hypothetical protein